MSKKLTENGLWDSSRMILPQHKTAILRHQAGEDNIKKPQLDEQQLDWISLKINESYSQETCVLFEIYNPTEVYIVKGIVRRIDQSLKRIYIENNDEEQWRNIGDIISIQ